MIMSVCRTYISETTHPNFTEFSVHVACGSCSVFIGRRSNISCTSGFVDDVTFANGSIALQQQTLCNVVHGLTPLLRGIGCVLS